MEFKGTQGEWVVEDDDFICCGEKTIAAIGSIYPLDEEDRNNRSLILAAPELLEALQDMVALVKSRAYPQPDKPLSDWGRAEAAEQIIKQALGEE